MKWHSRPLLRRLRCRVRDELRRSKPLWREYRRHRSRWWNRWGGGIFSIFYFLFLGSGLFSTILSALSKSGGNNALLLSAVLALSTTGLAFWRANRLKLGWIQSGDCMLLDYYPLELNEFFRWQWRKFFTTGLSHLVFLAVFLVVWCAFDSSPHITWPQVLGVMFLQWVVMMSLGICLASVGGGIRYSWIGFSFLTAAALLLWQGKQLSPIVTLTAPCVLYFLPSGWASIAVCGIGSSSDMAQGLAWAGSMAIPFLALGACFRVKRGWLAAENERASATVMPSGCDEEMVPAVPCESFAELHALEERIHDRQFLISPAWVRREPIDDFIAWLLNPREKNLVAFLLADETGSWTKSWRNMMVFALGGMAIAALIPHPAAWLLALAAGCISAAMSGQVLGGAWAGFSGSYVSITALYPVNFRELARVILKINAIRWLLWAPLAVLGGGVIAWKLRGDIGFGANLGAKIAMVLLAVQPAFVALQFSQCSTDTHGWKFRDLRRILAIFGLILLEVPAAIMLVIPGGWGWLAPLVVASISWAFLGWYRHWYDRVHFDLIPFNRKVGP